MRFSTVCLVLSGIAFVMAGEAWAAEKAAEPDFNSKLYAAHFTGLAGDFETATASFEELLSINSQEPIIYLFYADILEIAGDFARAAGVLDRGLAAARFAGPEIEEGIREKIRRLGEKRKFREAMEDGLPWKDARLFTGTGFVVRTNMPVSYFEPVARRIASLLAAEQEMLAGILGETQRLPPTMSIIILGRFEDHQAFVRERAAEGKPPLVMVPDAYYDPVTREMIIFFDGASDWTKIAHEMVHFLIRELYLENPSSFLDEGLADYIAYKVEKADAKMELIARLNTINFLYDQGQWGFAMDLFTHWENYTRAFQRVSLISNLQSNRRAYLDNYVRYTPVKRMFYLSAWAMTHFFLEGGDERLENFFRQYIAYEKSRGFDDFHTARNYFRTELGEEGIRALDAAWGRYTIGLTYDTV
ncbi:MAG: tetratricopeptide repeat protein [Candidatus Omnitrophota bacterium]|nr:tetratricopeptide repeat protein [Candidatus Omnitrophota bacterium]